MPKKELFLVARWIGIDGSFAPWVGALITNIEQKILLICDEDSRVHGSCNETQELDTIILLGIWQAV